MSMHSIAVDGTRYRICLPHADTDYIQGKISRTGQPYELSMLQDMAARLQPGALVLDIGANIGNHSLYLAIVARAAVHAFEPNDALCQGLEQSIQANDLENLVTVHQAGVSDAAGFATFRNQDTANLGAQSLTVQRDANEAPIRLVRLDDLIFDLPVSMVKIDVEGMELDVLDGARKLIQTDRPLLYIEAQTVTDFEKHAHFLESFGYFYLRTFNATPTHIYLHESHAESIAEARRYLFGSQVEAYALRAAQAQLKEQLKNANHKYSDATERERGFKEKLEAANLKYREASEQVRQLKDQVRSFELDKKEHALLALESNQGIEKALQQAQLELEKSLIQLATRDERSELTKVALEARHAFELEKLQYGQQALEQQLQQTNEKYRLATDETKGLKEKINRLSAQQENLQQTKQEFERKVKAERAGLEQQLEAAQSETAGFKEKHSALEQQWRSQQQTQLELEKSLIELAARDERSELEKTALETSLQTLQQQLEETKNESAALQEKHSTLEQQLLSQQQVAAAAQAKYRQLTAENVPALKAKLDSQSQRSKELFQQLQELNKQLKAERQAKANAERRLSAVKMSNTWKAGQHIQKASGSFMEAVKLPVRLMRLRRKQQLLLPHIPAQLDALPQAVAPQPEEISVGPALLKTRPLASKINSDIRIACIMDEFTFGSYNPEAQLTQLTPEHWLSELDACQPELLFIESAWRGKDELWGNKVGHCSTELQGIVAWCKHRGIPTLFWNKEDPIHFETFLTTAKLFDYVFTTDMDCIQRYKAALGHEQVYFLPFACQPQVHNPVEKYQRKDAFCFAGAYYVRYPDRTRDLESFVAELPGYKPLEIYDRNYGKDHPDYQFPEQYQPYIVGTLRFDEIDKAYKGYNYAINLNSIKQSQSMFARRVYELLGSNTLTVSNFSRGLRLMFGDLVLTSDSGAEIKRRLTELQEQGAIDRLRLAGLRKAMSEHTYTDRLNYALEKITGQARSNGLPRVHVIAHAGNPEEVQRQLNNVLSQQGVTLTATLVVKPRLLKAAQQQAHESQAAEMVRIISSKDLQQQSLQQLAGDRHWVASMHPQDHYGVHYLLDILLATRYTQAQIIGKGSWYSHHAKALKLHATDAAYQPAHALAARRSVISPEIATTIPAADWLQKIDNYTYSQPQQFAVDCYNYCKNLPEQAAELQAKVDDLVCNQGASLNQLLQDAEATQPLASNIESKARLSGRQLAQWLQGNKAPVSQASSESDNDSLPEDVRLTRNKGLKTQISGNALHIESSLEDGKHEYIYAPKNVKATDLWQQLGQPDGQPLDIHFATDPGLNLNLVLLYLDAKGERISHQMILPNRNSQLHLPEGATHIKVGLRVYAGGSADIKSVIFGHLDLEPGNIQGQSDVLVLTNHYPSYDDLYRNGFVHTRVRAYAELGIKTDIFRLRKEEPIRWHEFQNADVTTGSQNALRKMLQSGRYRHVLVHFLDPDMWDVLKGFIDDIRVTVWVHGAEIHPWHRRKYNIQTTEQEEQAKKLSAVRMSFWRGLLNPMPPNLHMVFVSNYFASEVMEDLGFKITDKQFSIIHNPIDTELFNYIEKDAEQRKKILSIRPFSTRQYANDLTVNCILELSKKPGFEQLSFTIIGDGVLFEETIGPLRKFENVYIQKKFLTHTEIAALHKEHGVFLCPTRWDSQGVSRDEAMSSGLVPITTAVAAIPEFADESCAVLAAGEDYIGLAKGVELLIAQPELFKKLSGRASLRVHQQAEKDKVVGQEVRLLSR